MKKTAIALLLASQAVLAHPHPPHPPHPPEARLVSVGPAGLELESEGWHKSVIWSAPTDTSGTPLRAGQFLHVRDEVQPDGSYLAREVEVRHPEVHGRVLSRSAGELTVDFHRSAVPIELSDATRCRVGWLPAPAAVVTAGMHVRVTGEPDAAGRFQAETVHLDFPWAALLGAGALSLGVAFALRRRQRGFVPRRDD